MVISTSLLYHLFSVPARDFFCGKHFLSNVIRKNFYLAVSFVYVFFLDTGKAVLYNIKIFI